MQEITLRNILVPLDGSTEAESVLPYVRDLAAGFDSHVDVLGVGIGRRDRRLNRLLEEYVGSVEANLCADGIKARGVLLYGTAADQILNYASENEFDLIIMATHGRGGITRWWVGSVAEKVVGEAPTPVLLIGSRHTANASDDQKPTFGRILAPLDGSDIGEAALPYVQMLAMKTQASVSLLQIIATPGTVESGILGNSEWRKLVKSMHDAGMNYLGGMAQNLNERGVSTTCEVVTGDPADKIVQYAEQSEIGLIAMSTHGRTGLARWMLGSVADKVLHVSISPMLLVRSPRMIIPRSGI